MYDNVFACYEGGAIQIELNGKHGLYNKVRGVVLKPEYDEVSAKTYGAVRIKRNGKYGLLNRKCEELLPMIYDDIIYVDRFKVKLVLNGKEEYFSFK